MRVLVPLFLNIHCSENETRHYTIGLTYTGLLYVVFTIRDKETIRIIHARIADPAMVKYYEQENKSR